MDAAQDFFGWAWPGVWTLAKIVAIAVPLILCVAYLTLAERKVIGWMQVRIGPNRVGPLGLLQPFADVFKLLFKEIIVPTGANRYLFFIAPLLSIGPALAAWAVIPFTDSLVLANINAGLLYVLAISSMGVYGIILAGWASNSKYAFLGALRSAAQIVAYEIAMGFALVGVLMAASSLNLGDIVRGQDGGNLALVHLAAAAAVRRLPGIGRRRDQPPPVRRRRGRIGDRRRLPRRVFGHRLRGVLPRRVHEHDPDRDALRDHVPRRLAGAVGRSSTTSRCRGSGSWATASAGCSSRSARCCLSFCGSGRPSRATATTRSCAWAGRSSSR